MNRHISHGPVGTVSWPRALLLSGRISVPGRAKKSFLRNVETGSGAQTADIVCFCMCNKICTLQSGTVLNCAKNPVLIPKPQSTLAFSRDTIIMLLVQRLPRLIFISEWAVDQ
jgi:hypothetical protein